LTIIETETSTPNDFKETELGPLPVDWEVVQLGAIANIKYGKAKPKTSGTVPVIGSGGIYAWANEAFVDFPTLIIGRKGTAGRVWFVDKPCWPSDTTFYLQWKKAVDVTFLHGYFTLNPLSGEHAKTTLPSLQRPDLENCFIPLPPLPEQRRIAHVLNTIQRQIAAQDALIAAAREVKRSLMQRLFTYGPGPEPAPTKETEIGDVPEHWEMVELGELVEVKGGKRLPKGHPFANRPTAHPYIRVVDFKNNSVDKSDLRFVTIEDHEKIKRYVISSIDVYISIAGTIGLVGAVPKDLDGANLTENAAKLVIRNQDRLSQQFLVYYLASEEGQKQIQVRATKTSQPKLALMRIKQIPISFPPLPEQHEIAHILTTADRKIAAEEQRKAALQELFKSMLHQLMTGQLRLQPSPPSSASLRTPPLPSLGEGAGG
jgi:type I restriction enzyme S subunit